MEKCGHVLRIEKLLIRYPGHVYFILFNCLNLDLQDWFDFLILFVLTLKKEIDRDLVQHETGDEPTNGSS
jgi:hypothetical protein